MVSKKGAEKLNKLFEVVYSSLDDQFNMASPLLPDTFLDPATGEQKSSCEGPARVHAQPGGVHTVRWSNCMEHPQESIRIAQRTSASSQEFIRLAPKAMLDRRRLQL